MNDAERFAFFCRLLDQSAIGYPPEYAAIAEIVARSPAETLGRAARPMSRYLAYASAVRRKLAGTFPAVSRRTEPAPVHVAAVFPFRRPDHIPLLARPLARLASEGVRVAIVGSKGADPAWEDHFGASWASVVMVGEDTSVASVSIAYREARRSLPLTRRLVDDLGLSKAYVETIQGALVSYWRDFWRFSQVLSKLRPRVVLGLHYVSSPGSLAALDRYRGGGSGVSNILVQHGVFDHRHAFHDFAHVDVVALWGEFWRQELSFFREHGDYRRPEVVITGNPKLEAVKERVFVHGTPIRERGMITWVHTPRTDPAIERLILKGLTEVPGATVQVKPHPTEDRDRVRRSLGVRSDQRVRILDPMADPFAAISRADVVVGTNSTLLAEAAALDRPVIYVEPVPGRAAPWRGRAFAVAADASCLTATASRLIHDDAFREQVLRAQQRDIEPLFGPIDGAAERIASLIRERLSEPRDVR